MRDAFRTADRAELALAIRDVALRTRVGSCGSQGLTKYLVLLDRPLRGVDHDLILYLKREIPTAAERTGLVATDPRPQGQRCAEDTAALTDPRPAFVSWCHIGQDSYWVTSRDPRTDELDPDAVRDFKSLLRAARVWATVAGAAHGRAGRDRLIVPRLSADLLASLRWRADAYLQKVERGFADFQADPRVAANVAAAEAALAEAAIGNR